MKARKSAGALELPPRDPETKKRSSGISDDLQSTTGTFEDLKEITRRSTLSTERSLLCKHCGTVLITAEEMNGPQCVLNSSVAVTQSERKLSPPFVEKVEFRHTVDDKYHMFNTLIPNVLCGKGLEKGEGTLYHLLLCVHCKSPIGKYFTIVAEAERKYEGMYCFLKDSVTTSVTEVKTAAMPEPELKDLSIPELKVKLLQLREDRNAIDGKILSMIGKVTRKLRRMQDFVGGYNEKYKRVVKDIGVLKNIVISIDDTEKTADAS